MNKNVTRRSFVTGATGAGALAALAGLAGCNQKKDDGGQKASGEKKKKLTMVTDTGGVNDQSFNQSAWEGMTELKDKNGWDVSYLESKQDSDYATNLDKAVDAESDLVWGVGFAMADATLKAAKDNPNTQFAIIDNGNYSQVSNFTGVRSLPLLLATLLLALQRLARLALLAAFLPHLSTSLSMVTAAALLMQTRKRAPTLRFLHSTQSPSPMLQRVRLLLTPCTPMVATLSSTLQAA